MRGLFGEPRYYITSYTRQSYRLPNIIGIRDGDIPNGSTENRRYTYSMV